MIRQGKEFLAAKPPVSDEEDTANASRWPILRAWRWLAIDTEKEKRFSELYENEKMKAIDVHDEFDVAYTGIVPASLGRAIQRIEKEKDIYSRGEEYATMIETKATASEI